MQTFKTQVASCSLSWKALHGSLLVPYACACLHEQVHITLREEYDGLVQEGPGGPHPLLAHYLRPYRHLHPSHGGTPQEYPPGKAEVIFSKLISVADEYIRNYGLLSLLFLIQGQ